MEKDDPRYKVYILANKDQTKIPKRTRISLSEDPKKRIKNLKLESIHYRGFDDLYLHNIYESHAPASLLAAAHTYFEPYRCKDIKGFKGYSEFFDVSPELVDRFLIKAGAKLLPKP